MAKIGANELCHCGSGTKYKKCCRDKDEKRSKLHTPTPEQLEGIMRVAHEAPLKLEQSKYRAPEYQEFELGGQKFRIVGRGIYPQPHSGQLGDVIVEHLKTQVLGRKWLEEEGRKSPDKQHVVARWLDAWEELRRKGQEAARASDLQTYSAISGEAQELLALADDASRLLQMEKKFPKKLRTRLLNRNEFQGARYELAIAATFIRTNFRIEWIDDKTGPANGLGKRCDFNAIHQVTGETIAVETKSRRRKGRLNEAGEAKDEIKLSADVYNLYREATEQNPGDKPFAIFIDINLPHQPARGGADKTWTAEVEEILKRYGAANLGNPAPFSFVFFTNFAWHFRGREVAHTPEHYFSFVPGAAHQISKHTFDAIGWAVHGYGSLPSGYLKTASIYPIEVPESARELTTEITLMTQAQAQSTRTANRTISQGFRVSQDAPRMEPQAVEIPVLEGVQIKSIVGVWFEAIENAEALNSFERLDVVLRTDEHCKTHFDLLASSRKGVAAETKIRVHVIYEI
jgi:SEC-C motif